MHGQPSLFHCDTDRDAIIATGLADPSLTLIENGPAFGVLIADNCHEDRSSVRFFLDRVTWVRGDDAVEVFRRFEAVSLYRDGRGIWLAEETQTRRLFPQPSRIAYQVEFLSEPEHETLRHYVGKRNFRAILQAAYQRFARLPGFRLQNEKLVAPEGYANAAKEAPVGAAFVSETR